VLQVTRIPMSQNRKGKCGRKASRSSPILW
jgi:hypothetical protein